MFGGVSGVNSAPEEVSCNRRNPIPSKPPLTADESTKETRAVIHIWGLYSFYGNKKKRDPVYYTNFSGETGIDLLGKFTLFNVRLMCYSIIKQMNLG